MKESDVVRALLFYILIIAYYISGRRTFKIHFSICTKNQVKQKIL